MLNSNMWFFIQPETFLRPLDPYFVGSTGYFRKKIEFLISVIKEDLVEQRTTYSNSA